MMPSNPQGCCLSRVLRDEQAIYGESLRAHVRANQLRPCIGYSGVEYLCRENASACK